MSSVELHLTAAKQPQNAYHHQRIMLLAMVVLLLVAPFAIYPIFLIRVLCFALFACAFNLLVGYVGLLAFGHAAFFGGASYIAAHAAKVWGFPTELALLSGMLFGAVLGLAMGLLSIRRHGIYFSMVTLALAQMFYFFCLQAPFTHGEDGIQSVPRGTILGIIDLRSDLNFYFLTVAIFLFGFVAIHRIIHSPFGQVLKAIRENEQRTISLGYIIDRYKLAAFVLSTTLVGLAGSVKALAFQQASLTDVHWSMSGEVILMSLIGGLGTVFGPIIGAIVVIGLEYYLSDHGDWVTVVQGVVFVICVLAFRRGIVGEIARFVRKPL